MKEKLQAIRDTLEYYAKADDGAIELLRGFAYAGEKDSNSPARKGLALLDEVMDGLDSEELVEEATEAVIDNKRQGIIGVMDANWYPSNYEYGNIKAEVQTTIGAVKDFNPKKGNADDC